MRSRRNSSRPSRLDHIDELDARLSALAHELKLIADVIDGAPSQRLQIDSRGLSALLNRVADSLQAAQKAATAAWHSKDR